MRALVNDIIVSLILLGVVFSCSGCQSNDEKIDPGTIPAATYKTDKKDAWRYVDYIDRSKLHVLGPNEYFSLVPGTKSVFQDGDTTLTITVLDEMKVVDAVTTRVVEEREEKDGQPVEISRNYFTVDRASGDVFYFGEDVDIYKDGKIVGHDGAWLSGVEGAHFGLMLPGHPTMGDKYYEERADGVAMDRGEIVSTDTALHAPMGDFLHCVKVKETSLLEPNDVSYKWYAKGIGLVRDDNAVIVVHEVNKDH